MLKEFNVATIGNSPVNKPTLLSIGRIKQLYSATSLSTVIEYIKNARTKEIVRVLVLHSISDVQAKMAGYVSGTSFLFPFSYNGTPRTEVINDDSVVWGFATVNGSQVFYEVSNSVEPQQYLSSLTLAQILTLSNASTADTVSIESIVGTETSINGESGGVVKALDVIVGSQIRFIITRKTALVDTEVTVTGLLLGEFPDVFIIPAGQLQYLYEKEAANVPTGTEEVVFSMADAGGGAQEITFTFEMTNTSPSVVLNDISEGAVPGDYTIDIDFTNAYPFVIVTDVNYAELQVSDDGVAGWVDLADVQMGDGVTAPYTGSQADEQTVVIDIAKYYRIAVKDNSDNEFYSNVFSYPTAVSINSITDNGGGAADFDVDVLHAYEMTEGDLDMNVQVSDDGLADWVDAGTGSLTQQNMSGAGSVITVAIALVDGKYYRAQVKDIAGAVVSSIALQFVAISSVTLNSISDVAVIDVDYVNAFEVTPATLDASIEQSDDGLGGWAAVGSVTLPSSPFTGNQTDDLAATLVDGKFYRVAIKNIVGDDFYSAAVEFTAQVTALVLNTIEQTTGTDTTTNANFDHAYEMNTGDLDFNLQVSDDGLGGWADVDVITGALANNDFTAAGEETLFALVLVDTKYYRIQVKDYTGATVSSNAVQYNA